MATITVVQHSADITLAERPLDYIDPLIYGVREVESDTQATFTWDENDEKFTLTITGTIGDDQIVTVDEYGKSDDDYVLVRTIAGVHVNIDAVLDAISNGTDYAIFDPDDAFNIDGSAIPSASHGYGLYYFTDAGDDTIVGSNFVDIVSLYGGKDSAHGGGGTDEFDGGSGNDSLYGDAGNDILAGGTGDDVIDGGPGSDWYTPATLFTTTSTGATVDLSRSVIHTAYGTDTLVSIENVFGTGGKDHLYGTRHANRLLSGPGTDTLKGLGGDDRLGGGIGKDRLYGGSGKDQFVFAERGTANADHIVDYNVKDDTIRLDRYDFTKLASGTLKSGNFVVGTHAKDGNDYVVYDRAHGKLYYDADGNHKSHGLELIAIIDNHAHLTHADIVVSNLETTNYWLG